MQERSATRIVVVEEKGFSVETILCGLMYTTNIIAQELSTENLLELAVIATSTKRWLVGLVKTVIHKNYKKPKFGFRYVTGYILMTLTFQFL